MTARIAITTKLSRPLLGRDIITRARLLERLSYHRPLTLVVAPAGYGKTTLVASWLEQSPFPSVWLTLDKHDNGLTAYLSYVLAAIQKSYPNTCPETEALLNSALLPSVSVITNSLVNELAVVPEPFMLVLDDYHVIQDIAVHQLMGELLHYQPGTLEIILVTRHDPPLPLSSLRAHNSVTEIRAQDLRFSKAESRLFLQRGAGLALSETQVEWIEKSTEGWAAGLRLAALLIQQDPDAADAATLLDGSQRFAIDYLASEIYAQQSPEMQRFLVTTAILERVSAPLAAAMMGNGTSVDQCQAFLDSMGQFNLFVNALSGDEKWYRYHHLLRAVLRNRAQEMMSVEEQASLHTRASLWLAAHGEIDAAIGHAVAAGNLPAVADLVRVHRHALLNAENWGKLETWRQMIPRAMIESHPQLLVLDAWTYSHQARLTDVAWCLRAIEALLQRVTLPAGEARLLRSELNSMQGQISFWSGAFEVGLESTSRALSTAPYEHSWTRTFAWLWHVECLELMGEPERAARALEEAIQEEALHTEPSYRSTVLTIGGFLYWVRGNMQMLDEHANHMLVTAQERVHLEGITYARYFRGCARYQQNDLVGAENDFAIVVDMAHFAKPFIFVQSIIGLAAARHALGQFDKAFEGAANALSQHRDKYPAVLVERLEGFLAHLCFRQGKMNEALRWLSHPAKYDPRIPIPMFHVPAIARAAILLGQGEAEATAEAAELLALLRTNVDPQHNTRFRIEVLALQALALASSGAQDEALELLEQAVQLTIPGNTIRALADLDFQIGPLLALLAQTSPNRAQIARIRRAAQIFGPPERIDTSARRLAESATPLPASHERIQTLQEALTNRELDVLLLLLERPSNKEIAQQLNVTTDTVKRHLFHIFRKLQVENRRQAVVEARRLGILPPA